MKLIPIYTWNKGILNFNHKNDRLSKKPWFLSVANASSKPRPRC